MGAVPTPSRPSESHDRRARCPAGTILPRRRKCWTSADAESGTSKLARILVLGGDGFCGWPTSLHLSRRGHDVTIVDNLSRRKIDVELEVESLTPIRPISERLRAWKAARRAGTSVSSSFTIGENYHRLLTQIREEKPDVIIHFAEQRAAPYSMKSVLAQALHRQQQPQRHQRRALPRSSNPRSTSISSISAPWASTATARRG